MNTFGILSLIIGIISFPILSIILYRFEESKDVDDKVISSLFFSFVLSIAIGFCWFIILPGLAFIILFYKIGKYYLPKINNYLDKVLEK